MNGRLTRQVETWIDEGIEKYGMGDQFLYELQFNPQPPALAIVMFMPGLILNTWVSNIMMVDDVLSLDQEACHDLTRQAIEYMRTGRSEQAKQEIAKSNGGLHHEVTAERLE